MFYWLVDQISLPKRRSVAMFVSFRRLCPLTVAITTSNGVEATVADCGSPDTVVPRNTIVLLVVVTPPKLRAVSRIPKLSLTAGTES
jgi:hypothetical protein